MGSAFRPRQIKDGSSSTTASGILARWKGTLVGVYLALLVVSGFFVLDATLPTRTISASVVSAKELRVDVTPYQIKHGVWIREHRQEFAY